ncbi:MAG TPA: GNAT family N-acetyltransferase [Ginsengibacter sp.]
MNVIIRKADEQDFPSIFALMKEFSVFQKTPEKVRLTLEQLIAEKDIFQCIVATTDDNEIIGFASFFFTYYSWSGKGLYLDDLYVKEGFRNQSIGKKLLEAIIDFAKQERCKKVRWLVSGWNTNAIEFYKKMGAVVDGTELTCDLSLQ